MRDAVIQRLVPGGVEWLATGSGVEPEWTRDAAAGFLFSPDEAMRERVRLKEAGVWCAVAFRGRPVPGRAFFRFALPRRSDG